MTPMRILVFGRNGQVARSLQALSSRHQIQTLGRNEANLMTQGAARIAIETARPDVVINAAAYTAVDKAEEEQAEAGQLNTHAPAEMAEAAKIANATFIHLSTDYVFDGALQDAYNESDPVNPLNVYGKTKRAGEDAVLKTNPKAIVLRTSWVFSAYGANFVKTMLRLGGEKENLNIVSDQIGGPTSAEDIAQTATAIAEQKHAGAKSAGLYHYQGTPAVSWADFARQIFEFADMNVAVSDIGTADYPTPARRPLHTVLDCAKE